MTSRRKFLATTLAGLSIPISTLAVPVAHEHKLPTFTQKSTLEETYLQTIKVELKKDWPENRIINLVFHGHSVPSGYFKTPEIITFQSYPFLLLKQLKSVYSTAVINAIITAKGGENSIQGQKRFKNEVLNHKPNVLFIDYALNDAGIGAEESRKSWAHMIKVALKRNVKVILLTATPDQRVDLLSKETDLQKICNQVVELSKEYQVGLVDNYTLFQNIVSSGEKVTAYMSQVNHPNEKGHQLVVDGIMKYF
jgi:acyl-CoA thioesterase I